MKATLLLAITAILIAPASAASPPSHAMSFICIPPLVAKPNPVVSMEVNVLFEAGRTGPIVTAFDVVYSFKDGTKFDNWAPTHYTKEGFFDWYWTHYAGDVQIMQFGHLYFNKDQDQWSYAEGQFQNGQTFHLVTSSCEQEDTDWWRTYLSTNGQQK